MHPREVCALTFTNGLGSPIPLYGLAPRVSWNHMCVVILLNSAQRNPCIRSTNSIVCSRHIIYVS